MLQSAVLISSVSSDDLSGCGFFRLHLSCGCCSVVLRLGWSIFTRQSSPCGLWAALADAGNYAVS